MVENASDIAAISLGTINQDQNEAQTILGGNCVPGSGEGGWAWPACVWNKREDERHLKGCYTFGAGASKAFDVGLSANKMNTDPGVFREAYVL